MGEVKSRAARDWTVAEIEALPEDGNRYEIIDGELLVTPTPDARHQIRAFDLARALYDACPPEMLVFASPIGVTVGTRRHLEPDVSVKPRQGYRDDTVLPLLVVEVLSPSTWRIDVRRKRQVYAETGVPSYWIVDPLAPALTVLELEDGDYVERAVVGPGEELTVERPFPVRLAPGEWTPDLD
jgi:Uma2 family endonuclease